jgi:tetratricopeptide (TPR) repeat protein
MHDESNRLSDISERKLLKAQGTDYIAGFKGTFDQAVEDYNRVIALEPEHLDAHFHRGSAQEKLGKLDEAVKDFSTVIKLDPNHAKALYARGACLNLKGDFVRAVGKHRVAAAEDPPY